MIVFHLVGAVRIGHGRLQLFQLGGDFANRSGAIHHLGNGATARHLAHVLAEITDGDAAIDGDLALVGLLLAHDHAEERRLAGAVGTDEADLLALVERRGGLDEKDLVAVLLADIVEANHTGRRSWSNFRHPLRACGPPTEERSSGAAVLPCAHRGQACYDLPRVAMAAGADAFVSERGTMRFAILAVLCAAAACLPGAHNVAAMAPRPATPEGIVRPIAEGFFTDKMPPAVRAIWPSVFAFVCEGGGGVYTATAFSGRQGQSRKARDLLLRHSRTCGRGLPIPAPVSGG